MSPTEALLVSTNSSIRKHKCLYHSGTNNRVDFVVYSVSKEGGLVKKTSRCMEFMDPPTYSTQKSYDKRPNTGNSLSRPEKLKTEEFSKINV